MASHGDTGTPYPGTQYREFSAPRDPFSGSYRGIFERLFLDVEVDLDQIRQFSPTLNIVSGTILDQSRSQKLWAGDSSAAYFRSQNDVIVKKAGERHNVRAAVAVTLSGGGGIVSGEFIGYFQKLQGEWSGKIRLAFEGKTCEFEITRTSLFFREVNLDIDYTEKAIWPVVEMSKLATQPARMAQREMNAFTAFEDAGIKLKYSEKEGDKVEDPTPHSPWTRSDLYNVMLEHFDEVKESDANIWCMMGTTPPDKRYMGYSFDRQGKHGFGIFTGHSTFKGLNSRDAKERNEANRRLLHYLVHECGHCLGLSHPFEKGDPDSLSWMNYAWKYDERHSAGSFYRHFDYRFSDRELVLLRHAPGKNFKHAARAHVSQSVSDSMYGTTSLPPDMNAADDTDDDSDAESDAETEDGATKKELREKPLRKLELKLKFSNTTYKKGQLIDYEVRVRNVGKLPALIDGDLSAEGGNLQLYVADRNGSVQSVDGYARPIKSSYTKPLVLYTSEDDEGSDRYSDMGSIGEGKNGYVFHKTGKYVVKAKYSAGRYNVTSESVTIEIEDAESDDDPDEEAASQVAEMAQLGGSNHERFRKALAFFVNLADKPVQVKKGHVTAMIALFDGMSEPSSRSVVYSGARGKKNRKLARAEPLRSAGQLLRDTDDVIKYYHEKGERENNFFYAKLVMVRAKLYLKDKRADEADDEINRMYGDLIGRGVKYEVLKTFSKKWEKMKNPKPAEEKNTPAYYQTKAEKVLDWYPTKEGSGEKDITGLGIGGAFSNFDEDHQQKAKILTDMLHNKFDETQDVAAVMQYANGLQQSREANDQALKFAVECFIVHNRAARKVGIRYPEPPPRDDSLSSYAARTDLVRTGAPDENWMNYWRCDADFNYHHRHWHAVYNHRNPGEHLERRGELFGYMHTQMLARYDAERESWGIRPVREFTYEEVASPFNAGLEFHDHQRNYSFATRTSGKLSSDSIREFQEWERTYRNAITSAHRDPNWAGARLETYIYDRNDYIGNLHNKGHVVFSAFVAPGQRRSYIGSPEHAVRDPLFFRWHKHIDNLWQENNDRLVIDQSDLDRVKAEVTIESSDIAITSSPDPKWEDYRKDGGETIKTYLKKPTLLFEHDDKLDHDPFYYHLRFRNTKPGKITVRIFICPEKCANDRRRWIEMDKFVHKLTDEPSSATVTRKDKESSVIKRTPDMYKGAAEDRYVETVDGFCECGWPYSMLLPRGTKAGEKYKLCVIATNSEVDGVATRTTCGSVSYCGAQKMKYPDMLQMGYPFTSGIAGVPEEKTLLEALSAQPNVALKTFVIQNQPSWRESDSVETPITPVVEEVATLWPKIESANSLPTDNDYRPSGWRGAFRVILYKEDINGYHPKARVKISFSGRGKGRGIYKVKHAEIAARVGDSDKTDPSRRRTISVADMPSFVVPEEGVISDGISLSLTNSRDYFVTFVLESPGCYISVGNKRLNTLVVMNAERYSGNWTSDYQSDYIRGRKSLYCVKGIIV